ncbi:ROS1 kinase, partial [Polyodon spathula]|nr:ROS1 kinase [Polyodon spathula]
SAPVFQNVECLTPETVEVSWSPPPFPGGSIVGYNLKLSSINQELHRAAGSNELQMLLYPTTANTTYRLTVVAVNAEGEGPAAEMNVTTPALEPQAEGQWLFLSRMDSLRSTVVEDLVSAADCLPANFVQNNITGIAVNYYFKQIYFTEGNRIWVKGAIKLSNAVDLETVYVGSEPITAISVDWMYQKLYFVMDRKMFLCTLKNCSSPEEITPYHRGSPKRIIADPYNGYIFLLMDEGIYKMNLPELSALSKNITLVVRSDSMQDFVVSYKSKRLIYFNDTDRSISSVFLDGSSFYTIRPPVGSINTVVSLAYEADHFMITNAEEVFHETQYSGHFFYNTYMVGCDETQIEKFGFDNLLFFSESSQPYPVPLPPKQLQSLFGSDIAALNWEKPEPRIKASPAAWQNWTYTVRVSAEHLSVDHEYKSVVDTKFTVTGLNSSTKYSFTVQAESPGGRSPWSNAFEGTTLRKVKESPYILAAGKDGIWKHQVEKFDPGILIYPDIKQATHIDWYNSTIFWSDLAGHVHMMPPDSNVVLVSGILQAGSLAFDWLGQHLYWAGLASKTIYRTALTSMQTEVVAQVRHLVIDFVVDSVNAFLYWTTSLTVECARLNGEKHQVFQEHHLFSNKQVFALASDLNLGHLYWLVQDGMYLHLYRVNLLREGFVDTSITEFAAWSSLRISRHGLQFYSGRLFWLDGNNTLTVQEVNQSSSVPLFTATQLRAFTLVHVSMKPLPDGYVSTPIVIPQSVPISSIRIEGNYSIARVVWNASRNVEYGTVFYCVESETLQLHENRSNKHCLPPNELSTPAFEVNGLQPHTKFDISITPYTYWGKGQTTMTILQTPTGEKENENQMALFTVAKPVSVSAYSPLLQPLPGWYRRRKIKQSPSNRLMVYFKPDAELAEIRGLASSVGLVNACYAISFLPTESGRNSLPGFPRERLRLCCLLGSGAFGEVYEGVALDILGKGSGETKVAVKTLKNVATDHEKAEFLKEAHLMSQFDHPHILKLLGVCLMNEPHFIILELMKGGDLRTYLREARATRKRGSLLSILDLLDVCVDVSKGCAYLEKMHFVHRDLAARNCLVSVKEYGTPERLVKIGDFGLARDIYKNDYYRKRGEGLLPVRWMAPESLIDGVFTKYSDVWSFGVLLWEIITLGEQPYPAYSNLEVLHLVRSGGRLPSPTNCPDDM